MSAAAGRTDQGTILVVDDERDILIAVEDLFEDQYRVITCDTPAAALELLENGLDPAVIISDQRMPGMSGDAFLEEARRLTEAETILLTGYADLSAVVRAVNRGRIVGYVPKPWDSAALTAMVAGALERRQLAIELATERALLHGLMENSGDAISFKDRDGHFIRLNEIRARRIDTTCQAALGRSERDFVSPDEADAIELADQAAIHGSEPSEILAEVPDRAGTRWFSTRRIPIPGGNGAIDCLVTIEREVTQQRQLEERLRQADKMQALGTLAGGVAHDFNNLLTAILGSIDLATRRCNDQPEVKRLLGIARQAGERAASLTQRLLSFGRKREFNPRVINVGRVIEGMEDLLARTLVEIDIHREIADDLWDTRIDPDQLELAILNLAVNARDAMPSGGKVTISAMNLGADSLPPQELSPGDYIRLTVSDNGSGVPPDIAARVFEPFFTTKEPGKGTGLGLSMVYALAQQSGGTVMLDSRAGEGTDVHVFLPRVHAGKSAVEREAVQPVCGKPVRILLVDDDAHVRGVTAAILGDMGHQVVEAGGGDEALGLLSGRIAIDVVIADVAMPGMNGIEFAERVQSSAPALRVLLISGNADESVADFPMLHKPFQRDELARAVAALSPGA